MTDSNFSKILFSKSINKRYHLLRWYIHRSFILINSKYLDLNIKWYLYLYSMLQNSWGNQNYNISKMLWAHLTFTKLRMVVLIMRIFRKQFHFFRRYHPTTKDPKELKRNDIVSLIMKYFSWQNGSIFLRK